MRKIGIIGYGYVGKAIERMLSPHYSVRVWYPNSGTNTKDEINESDLAIVCVPTPMSEEFVESDGIRFYRCDTSIVEESIAWITTPVILIKSTVEIGTTDRLKEKYRKRICFSPEYVGEGKYHVTPRMDFQTSPSKTPIFIFS